MNGLPSKNLRAELIWEFPLPGEGHGGVAATDELIAVSSRSVNDDADLFYLLDPIDGALIFEHEIPSRGNLDYGNSPRATPVIDKELVIALTAFGKLIAMDPAEGNVRWQKDLIGDFGGRIPIWGYCASPLLHEDHLIVQPGGREASIVSLDVNTGDVRWRTPGENQTRYASPMIHSGSESLDGEQSIVGCDDGGLVAWSLQTGRERWRIKPEQPDEFMVPSPLVLGDHIVWLGESNGLRVHQVAEDSASSPKSVTSNDEILDEIQSPISVEGHVALVADDLLLVDSAGQLAILDRFKHKSLDSYAMLLSEDRRVLVCCTDGTLLLLQVTDGKWQLLSEARPRKNAHRVLAHPAWVDGKLYLRCERSLACYQITD